LKKKEGAREKRKSIPPKNKWALVYVAAHGGRSVGEHVGTVY
jgi:hypothetical protein